MPKVWKPTPHPLLPLPSQEQIAEYSCTEDGLRQLQSFYEQREQAIKLARQNPAEYFIPLPSWAYFMKVIEVFSFVYLSGGNRSGKSYLAAILVWLAAKYFPGTFIWCFAGNLDTSVKQQQRYLWETMPAQFRPLVGKKDSRYYIHWTYANGFSGEQIILPNLSIIKFLTYKQDPNDYEGYELGADVERLTNDGVFDPAKPPLIPQISEKIAVPNIGAWADESMPITWMENLLQRTSTRYAKLLWTFTPINGITPSIKLMRGQKTRIVKTAPSELLPDRVNVQGCPPGHMPILEIPSGVPNGAIGYMWSQWNPFGGYDDKRVNGRVIPGIKSKCLARNEEYIERRAYGYSRDSRGRAFPRFGQTNIVAAVPSVEGTWYLSLDPAPPARNWYFFLAYVTSEDPERIYIVAEWPDYATYGPWAVVSNKDNQPDGDRGPAQLALGWGIVRYKQQIDQLEAKYIPLSGLGNRPEVEEYVIDPRAAKDEHITEDGGTCVQRQLFEEQLDEQGVVVGRSIDFVPGRGTSIADGEQLISDRLDWNERAPFDPINNTPYLFVHERCGQMIWALDNYTGRGGEKGGCKDVIDALRYFMTRQPEHIGEDYYEVLPQTAFVR